MWCSSVLSLLPVCGAPTMTLRWQSAWDVLGVGEWSPGVSGVHVWDAGSWPQLCVLGAALRIIWKMEDQTVLNRQADRTPTEPNVPEAASCIHSDGSFPGPVAVPKSRRRWQDHRLAPPSREPQRPGFWQDNQATWHKAALADHHLRTVLAPEKLVRGHEGGP